MKRFVKRNFVTLQKNPINSDYDCLRLEKYATGIVIMFYGGFGDIYIIDKRLIQKYFLTEADISHV